MDIVQGCLIGMVVALVAAAGHSVLSWMGRRGWIFYGTEPTAPIGSRTAMALMEFETLLNPPVEHVLEYRRHGDLWAQESAEPDPDESDS